MQQAAFSNTPLVCKPFNRSDPGLDLDGCLLELCHLGLRPVVYIDSGTKKGAHELHWLLTEPMAENVWARTFSLSEPTSEPQGLLAHT